MTRGAGVPLVRDAGRRYRRAIEAVAADGAVPLARGPVARRLAAAMNLARAADQASGVPSVQAGELQAFGLLHEVFHHLIERYEAEARPGAFADALAAVAADRGDRQTEALLRSFGAEFQGAPATRAESLEELLLTAMINENPAAEPLRELFDDGSIAAEPEYRGVLQALEEFFAAQPAWGADRQSLAELLRAPTLAAPTSLAGQLRYVRDHWSELVAGVMDRVLGVLDVIAEEERALHLRFGGGAGGGPAEGGARGPNAGFGGPVGGPSHGGLEDEPERFSHDSDWMPRLVLIAKSTYVWLDQLSRHHGREIRRLDEIPDEELDRLAGWGVTGLWLIGLWQRSVASERIKRMRGNPDAAASAYSLDDYRIADDLGGEGAFQDLKARAWSRGIRMSSDMVPNHMGIDSRWLLEHPEWFLSLPEPPYPAYTFDGPDLSPDERVGIFLEDHYWDDSDAAVVFRRLDRSTGDSRYVYHGNDGTSFPWNDTAQLDYLKPDVREQVIRTILDVARRSPVIRFDAAMVLAKKHIQRLWYPEPGTGGGIPSRAEHGSMPRAAFDRAIPVEFWREVVDRVAAEVPDTLLLAEAFWLLEGYFVRTLGMHRVYNSAFMHMLRDEDNAGYRRVIKETLEFDTEILQRYVNFMNNPDEKTAVEQFGKGDKYFGVATLLATLPGLPMLGHGQVEGFSEKYGMEFRRATLDEQPDRGLVERHEREIFPLLHRRGWFAGAAGFLLYDLETVGGVDENVFAYSNGTGPRRSLVIYHNRYGSTSGRIRESAPFATKQSDGTRPPGRRTLVDGLGLAALPDDAVVAFREARAGLEHLRTVGELRTGLRVELGAYDCRVFWEFREVPDPAGVWRRLADRLGDGGVASLDEALREQELERVLAAVREALRREAAAPAVAELVRAVAETTQTGTDELRQRVADVALRRWRALDVLASQPVPDGVAQLADVTDAGAARAAGEELPGAEERPGDEERPGGGLATGRPDGDPEADGVTPGDDLGPGVTAAAGSVAVGESGAPVVAVPAVADPWRLAILRAWSVIEPLGRLAPGAEPGLTSRAWFDELRLAPAVAATLREHGLDEAGAWSAVERIRLLLALPRPSTVGGRSAPEQGERLAAAWLDTPETRAFLRVNRWAEAEWFDRDAWQELCDWAVALEAVDPRTEHVGKVTNRGDTLASSGGLAAGVVAAAARAGYRVDALRDLLATVERPKPVRPRA